MPRMCAHNSAAASGCVAGVLQPRPTSQLHFNWHSACRLRSPCLPAFLPVSIAPSHPALPCPCCSMEGATLSGRQCAYKILEDAQQLARAAQAAQQQQQAVAA